MAADRNRHAAIANKTIYTLTAGAGASTNILLRGDPENVGDLVAPSAVAAVSGVQADFALAPDAPEAERRRRLAVWISGFIGSRSKESSSESLSPSLSSSPSH